MFSHKTLSSCVFGLLVIGGCAHTPPRELQDARAAFKRASAGPASELNPAQLHVAQQSLAIAEQTYKDEGDSDRTRDRAYVALRKAQLAEVQARIAQADKEAAEWQRQAQMTQARMRQSALANLSKAKEELESERQKREQAEQRAQEAQSQLEKMGAKQDQRGMVLTMSGEVLFQSGKFDLRPAARRKLDQVAQVLSQSDDSTQIVVEGHTDNRGSAQFNQRLSQQRADSVRQFLVDHGVPADRVRAEGFGFSRPIADNKSAEGRANNRRVEIVMQPAGGAQGMSAPSGESSPGMMPQGGTSQQGGATTPRKRVQHPEGAQHQHQQNQGTQKQNQGTQKQNQGTQQQNQGAGQQGTPDTTP